MASVSYNLFIFCKMFRANNNEGTKKKFTNFNEVRTSIDLVTDQVCGKSKQIIDRPIILNIFSKSCPNLTIVDLPGITSIPVG